MPHPQAGAIVKLRKQQRTFREISTALGVPLATVHRVLTKEPKEYKPKPVGPKPLRFVSRLSTAQIHAMFSQGVKPLAIAVDAGVAVSTVYKWQKRWKHANSIPS